VTVNPDFTRYVDARWADLVGGLEDEGVDPEAARLAVAEALLASRRSWSRRVRDEQVDVSIWSEVRERAGLEPRAGETAPHGVRPLDPGDSTEEWFEHAEHARAARRRRGAGRFVVGLVVGAVLVAGWAWWAARPDPPPVREEANPLPVVWYSGDELHLADVVVELAGIEEFVAVGPDVAARLTSGTVVRVAADGAVSELDDAPDELDVPVPVPAYQPPGRYDAGIQTVPLPGGGWAHLIDSSSRSVERDALRQSESGRRALVVCTAEGECGEPITIVGAEGSIRLR
jgi:hypothetical protein